MSSSLDGKTIIVTGAAQGLGKAVCFDLAGAARELTLILIDRAETELASTEAELAKLIGKLPTTSKLITIGEDLRNVDQVRNKMKAVLDKLERVDILINNAGTNVDATIETLSDDDWNDTIESNLRGPFVMTQVVWERMKRQKSGHIVNVVSGVAMRIVPKSPAYPASKWGLRALSQSMYAEGVPHGIKVTAFMPAGMATPLILKRSPNRDPAELMDPAEVARFLRKAILELPSKLAVPEVYLCRQGFDEWP